MTDLTFKQQKLPVPTSSSDISNTLKAALNTHCQILFGDFDLRETDSPLERHIFRPMRNSEFTIIMSLFDIAYEIWQGFVFVTVHVKRLPPKPWPYAIARMPLSVTDSPSVNLRSNSVSAPEGRW